jgi:hypothetical protein
LAFGAEELKKTEKHKQTEVRFLSVVAALYVYHMEPANDTWSFSGYEKIAETSSGWILSDAGISIFDN